MKRWFPLIILVLSIGLYANTINHGFTLDDKAIIVGNKFTQNGFGGIIDHFTHSYWYGMNGKDQGVYRPLSAVSFSIERALFGTKPTIGHLLNIVFFALLCLILYRWISELEFFTPIESLIVVLLFASHPIHTEVVANIKGRDEIFCMLFLFISLLTYTKWITTKEMKHMVVALISFLWALLSKETALSLLPVFFLLSYRSTDNIVTSLKASLGPIITAVLFLGLYLSMTDVMVDAEYHLFDNSFTQEASSMSLFFTKFAVIGLYWKLLFIPFPLVYDYSYNTIPLMDLGDWQVLLGLVGTVALLGAAIYKLIKKGEKDVLIPLFASIIILPLIPVSNFFFPIGSTMAERFLFIPSLGFVALIILAIRNISKKLFGDKQSNLFLVGTGITVSLIFSSMTFERNKDWASDETLFRNDLKHLPENAKAHHNLANIYHQAGDKSKDLQQKRTYYETAIDLIEKAVTIHPVPEFYRQVGGLYGEVQRWDGAVKSYSLYLETNSKDAEITSKLGVAYGMSGDIEQALPYFEKAYHLNPKSASVCINLGKTYGMLGRYKEAMKLLNEALAIDPKNKEALEAIQITRNFL